MKRPATQPLSRGRPTKLHHEGSSIFAEENWQSLAHRFDLSGREVEITRGVFDDLKENQIAGELKISPHTVHTHLGRLYRKLGVSGRVQLVVVLAHAQLSPEPTRTPPMPWKMFPHVNY